MWQTLVVVLIVALAAGFVLRRLARQLSGRSAPCCGGEGGDQAASCAACQAMSSAGPQPLGELDRRGAGEACACGGPALKTGRGPTPAPDKAGEGMSGDKD